MHYVYFLALLILYNVPVFLGDDEDDDNYEDTLPIGADPIHEFYNNVNLDDFQAVVPESEKKRDQIGRKSGSSRIQVASRNCKLFMFAFVILLFGIL